MVGNLFTNENLDRIDCDTKCQKIQFLLNERAVLEHLSGPRPSRMEKMVLLVSSIEKTFLKKWFKDGSINMLCFVVLHQ